MKSDECDVSWVSDDFLKRMQGGRFTRIVYCGTGHSTTVSDMIGVFVHSVRNDLEVQVCKDRDFAFPVPRSVSEDDRKRIVRSCWAPFPLLVATLRQLGILDVGRGPEARGLAKALQNVVAPALRASAADAGDAPQRDRYGAGDGELLPRVLPRRGGHAHRSRVPARHSHLLRPGSGRRHPSQAQENGFVAHRVGLEERASPWQKPNSTSQPPSASISPRWNSLSA
ncbi:hypothetical protein EST92_03075 [Streptomyces sp. TM32]|uniref:hypothetical protein n=1 Tax=Streptomyces sp. TM32 TaxID=1652669 RepID=UPI0010126F49|nr:hypothetical protein [Streptomyces sp. TM32]RXS87575.1 hypothetical protein EST92_03075 [Streptomyces sp. TM32]